MRLIHRARNPGCFTSSPQATWRSDINDPPLPHPVSEYSLWYVLISIAFLTCLACLNFSGIGKTLKVLSSRDLFVLPGPSSRFYFGHTNYLKMIRSFWGIAGGSDLVTCYFQLLFSTAFMAYVTSLTATLFYTL